MRLFELIYWCCFWLRDELKLCLWDRLLILTHIYLLLYLFIVRIRLFNWCKFLFGIQRKLNLLFWSLKINWLIFTLQALCKIQRVIIKHLPNFPHLYLALLLFNILFILSYFRLLFLILLSFEKFINDTLSILLICYYLLNRFHLWFALLRNYNIGIDIWYFRAF